MAGVSHWLILHPIFNTTEIAVSVATQAIIMGLNTASYRSRLQMEGTLEDKPKMTRQIQS